MPPPGLDDPSTFFVDRVLLVGPLFDKRQNGVTE